MRPPRIVLCAAAVLLVISTSVVAAGASSQKAGAPKVHSPHNPIAKIIPKGSTGVQPFTSPVTCDQNVCMQIIGSGLHVDKWWMTAVLPWDMCTYGAYWAPPDTVQATGPELCGNAGDTYYSEWDNLDFSGSVTACNTAVQIGGKPCNDIFP